MFSVFNILEKQLKENVQRDYVGKGTPRDAHHDERTSY